MKVMIRTGMAAARRGLCALVFAGVVAAAPGDVPAGEETRLDPIVVTATRVEQRVSEQAASVDVVPREDIELRLPPLAGDVLHGIPGLDVQRSGSPGNLENIKIRGGLGTHTLVLVDGFPVNSPTLGEFDIGALPVDDFERIEVVRGAQSALYGSNAMSGVVNFIPRKGEEGRQYGLGLAGGSFESLKWNGFGQGAGPRGDLHFGLGGWESQGILPNDKTSIASFLGTGTVRAGERSRLHAILFSTDARKGIPIDKFSPRDPNHVNTRRDVLSGVRWEADFSKSFGVAASGSFQDEYFHLDDPADPDDPFQSVLDSLTKTRKAAANIQARFSPAPCSTTIAGVEYVKDHGTNDVRFSSIFGPGETHVNSSTYNRSLFFQEELRPTKRSGLSLGGRFDRNSEAGTEFNPKAAVFHEFEGTGLRLRAGAGRGFRIPTILERHDFDIGNPGLAPEVAHSYEAGADLSFSRGSGGLSATWFYQDVRGLIEFVPGNFGPRGFGEMRNATRAFSRGVESEATYRFIPEAAALLSYTWTDTWNSDRQKRIFGIPRHRGTASLLLSPAPGWEARADWRIESDQVEPPLNGARTVRSGYARVDLYAKYRWEPVGSGIRVIALSGKVENLLDRRYEERLEYPAPGFNFLLGAEARI